MYVCSTNLMKFVEFKHLKKTNYTLDDKSHKIVIEIFCYGEYCYREHTFQLSVLPEVQSAILND